MVNNTVNPKYNSRTTENRRLWQLQTFPSVNTVDKRIGRYISVNLMLNGKIKM